MTELDEVNLYIKRTRESYGYMLETYISNYLQDSEELTDIWFEKNVDILINGALKIKQESFLEIRKHIISLINTDKENKKFHSKLRNFITHTKNIDVHVKSIKTAFKKSLRMIYLKIEDRNVIQNIFQNRMLYIQGIPETIPQKFQLEDFKINEIPDS